MKVRIRTKYYKHDYKDKSPAVYSARQPKGVGTDVYADVRLAPVLKRHKDLRSGILKHETEEIRAWGRGSTRPHRVANRKEPRATRKLGGERGFWEEIARRERMR